MPEVVIRLLKTGHKTPATDADRYADIVVEVPVEGVKNASTHEDAAMRVADWARKKCPLDTVRVIRRAERVLVEVERASV